MIDCSFLVLFFCGCFVDLFFLEVMGGDLILSNLLSLEDQGEPNHSLNQLTLTLQSIYA